DRTRVDGRLVRRAAAEVFGRRIVPFAWPWAVAGAGVAAIAVGTWGLLADGGRGGAEPPPAVPATTAAARPAPEPGPVQGAARTTFGGTPARAAAEVALPTRPAAADAAPRGMPLDELLGDPAFATDTDSAFARLFELWDARFDPAQGAPCDQAVREGLRCLFR